MSNKEMKEFLHLVESEFSYAGGVSDRAWELLEQFQKQYQIGEHSPESISEKQLEQKRIKNLHCPHCLNTKANFNSSGLFQHFKNKHSELYLKEFGNRNVKSKEQENYGLKLGELAEKLIFEDKERKEFIYLWEYVVIPFFKKDWIAYTTANILYMNLCLEKFGKYQLPTMELSSNFLKDEILKLTIQIEKDEQEYEERKEREKLIEEIFTYLDSHNIHSKEHFNSNISDFYRKYCFEYYPEIKDPSKEILNKFSTTELKNLKTYIERNKNEN